MSVALDPAALTGYLPALRRIAEQAATAIMDVYRSDFAIEHKDDASPVTAADRAAEGIITPALHQLLPGVPVIAEEAMASDGAPDFDPHRPLFLVDPLDGTKEFVGKSTDFTVNIGLIVRQQPLLGVIVAPARERSWWGVVGRGAFTDDTMGKRAIRCRPQARPPVAVASKSHRDAETDAFLRARGVEEVTSVGSSLKFCLVAEGQADVYPRFGPTMAWDVAAGDAILRAAGGTVTTPDGRPFTYADVTARNGPFIAAGPHDA